MTRDEAISRINDVYSKPYRGDLSEAGLRVCAASGLADALVALGLLKLDEPKSERELVFGELKRQLGGRVGASDVGQVIDAIYANSFKIVKA